MAANGLEEALRVLDSKSRGLIELLVSGLKKFYKKENAIDNATLVIVPN